MVAIREQAQQDALWQYSHSPSMEEVQFQQWVKLLELRTGITLPESRKTFLQTNLITRMRELGLKDYQNYFELVTDGSRGNVEWEILVDKLTVHETRFYRDVNALNLIRESYLKQLLSTATTPYTLNAWSVGCATGEEPYSLGMVIEDTFNKKQGFYYGITASDVSRAALQTGRKAIYHNMRVTNVPAHIAEQHLEQIDAEHVQVAEQLRQKICFSHMNLIDMEKLPVSDMDIILCQNVLIYFKHDIRERILKRLVSKLKPGGIMVLGAGEVFSWTHPELEMLNHEATLAFRRKLPVGSEI